MSTAAPTVSLATDWQDSEMFDGASMGVRLAWVNLMTHARANGRAGKVKFRDKAFAKTYRLHGEAVPEMLRRALAAGAITVQGEFVILTNWKRYNDPKARSSSDDNGPPKEVTQPVVEPEPPKPVEVVPDKQEELTTFDRFWLAFPSKRRTKKGKARITFAKAAAKIDPEKIIAAAAEYAASAVGQGDFVQGPEPWLNGECWDDDRSAWSRSQTGSKEGRKSGESSLF